MPSYSNNQVIVAHYPFTNLLGTKVRPGIVVSAPHVSHDVFIVPLTSRVTGLLPGEFALNDWQQAGAEHCVGSKARHFCNGREPNRQTGWHAV